MTSNRVDVESRRRWTLYLVGMRKEEIARVSEWIGSATHDGSSRDQWRVYHLRCAWRAVAPYIADELPLVDSPAWSLALRCIVESATERWRLDPRGTRGRYGRSRATARSYTSRVFRLLERYISTRADPRAVVLRTTADSLTSENIEAIAKVSRPRVAAAQRVTAAERIARSKPGGLREYPLPGGRVFRFEPPEDLTMADVEKIALHLQTFAADFAGFGRRIA